jgi:hypothetical protein
VEYLQKVEKELVENFEIGHKINVQNENPR